MTSAVTIKMVQNLLNMTNNSAPIGLWALPVDVRVLVEVEDAAVAVDCRGGALSSSTQMQQPDDEDGSMSAVVVVVVFIFNMVSCILTKYGSISIKH